MAEVNPNDESCTRHIVWHHRSDSQSGQFIRFAVKAFDNKRQAIRFFKKISKELEQNKLRGLAENREYISADVKERKHQENAQRVRFHVRLLKKNGKI